MAKTLKIKTRNCRIIANIIEKNRKAGKRFDIWDCHSCIGNECREYIRSKPKLMASKMMKPHQHWLEFGQACELFLGISCNLICYGSTKLWFKYRDHLRSWQNPSAQDAIKMLRNLASGEWNVDIEDIEITY